MLILYGKGWQVHFNTEYPLTLYCCRHKGFAGTELLTAGQPGVSYFHCIPIGYKRMVALVKHSIVIYLPMIPTTSSSVVSSRPTKREQSMIRWLDRKWESLCMDARRTDLQCDRMYRGLSRTSLSRFSSSNTTSQLSFPVSVFTFRFLNEPFRSKT